MLFVATVLSLGLAAGEQGGLVRRMLPEETVEEEEEGMDVMTYDPERRRAAAVVGAVIGSAALSAIVGFSTGHLVNLNFGGWGVEARSGHITTADGYDCYVEQRKMNCKQGCPSGWEEVSRVDHGCCENWWSCGGNRRICARKICSLPGGVFTQGASQAGAWGAECTCPSGHRFNVGDTLSYGRSFACYGGVAGPVQRRSGDWSHFAVQCAGCEEVTVGSGGPTKSVWLPRTYTSCSPYPSNGLERRWTDRFAVELKWGRQLTVRRIDQNSAWGMGLKLYCCNDVSRRRAEGDLAPITPSLDEVHMIDDAHWANQTEWADAFGDAFAACGNAIDDDTCEEMAMHCMDEGDAGSWMRFNCERTCGICNNPDGATFSVDETDFWSALQKKGYSKPHNEDSEEDDEEVEGAESG